MFGGFQALFDLEATNQDFKTDLRDLYITSAQLIDVTASKNAIIIHVPYRLLKGFQKIQQRLVRELEKKFSGKDVVLVANRRIMPKSKSGSSKARPRSRTLTAVSLTWTHQDVNTSTRRISIVELAQCSDKPLLHIQRSWYRLHISCSCCIQHGLDTFNSSIVASI